MKITKRRRRENKTDYLKRLKLLKSENQELYLENQINIYILSMLKAKKPKILLN
jgi:ribosomal protein L18